MSPDTYIANSRPVIVGGAARSGTTLVSVMLNSHPDLVCGPESDLFRLRKHFHRLSVGPVRWLWHVWRGWTEPFASIARDFDTSIWRIRRMWRASPTPSAFIDRFFCDYARRHGVSRWAGKTPANVKYIEYLFRHFPRARFVHVIRNGRDVCCSVQDWYRRYHEEHTLDVESAAETWTRWVGLGRDWRQHPGYTEVYYEDLIFKPQQTLRRLLAFLEMAWTPAVLNFHADAPSNRPDLRFEHLQGVSRPIYASSVGRWRRDLGPKERGVVERIAGATRRELGYTRSPGWIHEPKLVRAASSPARPQPDEALHHVPTPAVATGPGAI